MMMFEGIASLAHAIEDLFYYLREENPQNIDCSALSDLIFEGVDFIKVEIEKIKNGDNADGSVSSLIKNIKTFLNTLRRDNQYQTANEVKAQNTDNKQKYYISPEKVETFSPKKAFKAVIYFEEGCEMENIRAFSIIHNLKGLCDELFYIPEDIIDNDESVEVIRQEGFKIYLKSDCSYESLHELLMQSIFLKDLKLIQLENDDEFRQFTKVKQTDLDNTSKTQPFSKEDSEDRNTNIKEIQTVLTKQSIISVSLSKLDKLMDLVGEMVIAEAMVIQNPDLKGLELNNFQKAARQLHKITGEIQDVVMSIRMVPVAPTFLKMHRIVRDMSKKLGKTVQLNLIGEETEVDKNIIDHISDPLMHLIRNAIDHGMELPEEREAIGKSRTGTVTLEARNSGSDVLIIVRDE